MRQRFVIEGLLRSEVSTEFVRELESVCPCDGGHGAITCSIYSDDDRWLKVLGVLSKHGFRLWDSKGTRDRKTQYRMSTHCEYSPEELSASPWIAAAISIEGRDEQIAFARDKRRDTYRGPWWEVKKMSKWKLMEAPSTGADVEGFFAIPQRIRNVIEKVQLRGAAFLPMKILKTEQEDMGEQGAEPVDNDDIKGPWWRMKLAHGPACHAGPPTLGLTFNAPVRFYPGELDAFQNTDLFLGQLPNTQDAYYLILSSQAYKLFVKEKIAATYAPVILERQ